MENLLLLPKARIKVSSVLNKDVLNYGKQHLLDDQNETCWNSDQGSPQYVMVDFGQAIKLFAVKIQFQGGFAGKGCELLVRQPTVTEWESVLLFQPGDDNTLQEFALEIADAVAQAKLIIHSSTDFYGRITVYQLAFMGEKTINTQK